MKLFEGDGRSAKWTLRLRFEPRLDASSVEVVVGIAGQWRDLVLFQVLNLTDRTFLHRFKSLRIKLLVYESLNHIGYLLFVILLLFVLLTEVGSYLTNQTGTATD